MRTPGGELVLDASGRLNGRGAYVDRDPACIDLAIERGLLAKALEASVPAGIHAELLAAAAATPIGDASGQE